MDANEIARRRLVAEHAGRAGGLVHAQYRG